jgi:hypothetical protein
MSAPAAKAAHHFRLHGIDRKRDPASRNPSSTGITRASSSATLTGALPGTGRFTTDIESIWHRRLQPQTMLDRTLGAKYRPPSKRNPA